MKGKIQRQTRALLLVLLLLSMSLLNACSLANRTNDETNVDQNSREDSLVSKAGNSEAKNGLADTSLPYTVLDQKILEVYRDFTKNSMQSLSHGIKGDDNLLFSPMSLHMSLSLLEAGANGSTKTKLNQVLWGTTANNEKSSNDFYTQLYKGVIETANSLWINDRLELSEKYKEAVKSRFAADLYTADFSRSAAVENAIIDWIKEKTHGMLGDKYNISISPLDSLHLLNALYLKDAWNDAFKEEEKTREKFTTASGKTKTITMMNQFTEENVIETDAYTMASLGLKDGGYVRFALPAEGQSLKDLGQNEAFYKHLFGYWYSSDIEQELSYNAEVSWKLPKIDETIELNLKQVLHALDLDILTDDDADFSAMVANKDEKLFLTSAIQQIRVKMDEEGVEAAAVTGLTMASAAPLATAPRVINMHLDRPYAFAVFSPNDVVLFCGLMNEVNEQEKNP